MAEAENRSLLPDSLSDSNSSLSLSTSSQSSVQHTSTPSTNHRWPTVLPVLWFITFCREFPGVSHRSWKENVWETLPDDCRSCWRYAFSFTQSLIRSFHGTTYMRFCVILDYHSAYSLNIKSLTVVNIVSPWLNWENLILMCCHIWNLLSYIQSLWSSHINWLHTRYHGVE